MPHHILVADDDPHIREVICVRAGEGRHGDRRPWPTAPPRCARSSAGRPSLVVLDVGMPEMDGLEVCRLIRRTSDVPILFLSARDEEIDRILGLEMGGDDYVTKPFSPRELVARVNVILRRARAAPANAAPAAALLAWPADARSGDAQRDLRRARARPDGDRVRDREEPAGAAGPCAEPRPADAMPAMPPTSMSPTAPSTATSATSAPSSPEAGCGRRDRDRARRRLPARAVRRVMIVKGQMAAAHRPGRAGHPADGDGAAAGRAVLLPDLREPAGAPDRGRADRPGCGDRRDLCARGARGRRCRPKSSASRSRPHPTVPPAAICAASPTRTGRTGRSNPASTLPSTARSDRAPGCSAGNARSGLRGDRRTACERCWPTRRATTLAGLPAARPARHGDRRRRRCRPLVRRRRGGARRACRQLRQRAALARHASGRRRRSIR